MTDIKNDGAEQIAVINGAGPLGTFDDRLEREKLLDEADREAAEEAEWIELLQNGADYWFVYTIDGEGKRTLRVNDPDRAISETINYYDIRDDKKKVERNFEEFSSSVSVSYNPDVEAGSFDLVVNTDYQEAVLEKYRTPEDSEYIALTPATVDATRKAALIAEDQSESRPVATFTTHADKLSKLTSKLYDIITLKTSRPDETHWEQPDGIVHDSTATDGILYSSTATDGILWSIGEQVVDVPGREYWGDLRCQIIEIGYNPSDLGYTIKARQRPESEVV